PTKLTICSIIFPCSIIDSPLTFSPYFSRMSIFLASIYCKGAAELALLLPVKIDVGSQLSIHFWPPAVVSRIGSHPSNPSENKMDRENPSP
ncbi:MAG: hypothetical protein PHS89_11775, partial [Syntrophaceticus schinkii]|nr:hypothetical protein [Syntrophaceticus schinkii]